MTRAIESRSRQHGKVIAWLKSTPERLWLRSDKDIKLIAFYPFRDFYGGWLIYEMERPGDKETRRFKTWIGNKMAKKLGVKEVYVYGRRAS